MARSLWTGSLSFGLVNVPVILVTGLRDLDLHFHQLHEPDGAPIEVRRWCSEEDVAVPYEDVARAFTCEDGTQVVLDDAELEAVEPRRTRTIDIEQFVDLSEVDPIFFDHPYLLLPAGDNDGTIRAYRLLTEVMAQTGRAALGRFVMRAREYLSLVRSTGGLLSLTTMVFAEDVRDPADVDAAREREHEPSAEQLDAAVAVIEELTCAWEPGKHTDRYRERLERVVECKRRGETVKAPEAPDAPAAAPDLMDALERTLAELTEDGDAPAKPAPGGASRQRQTQEAT